MYTVYHKRGTSLFGIYHGGPSSVVFLIMGSQNRVSIKTMQPKETNVIRAVVFDYGGVIEISKGGSTVQRISELLAIPTADFRTEYFKYNHLSNVENIPWEDMVMKVVSLFSFSEDINRKARAIIEEGRASRTINTELLSMFPILRTQGFKIAILSNYTSALREILKRHNILELVDEVVVSGEIGYQKPQKEASEILCAKLGVLPRELVFIDDATKSLSTASEVGYTPILYQNNHQLKADLNALGILI